MDNGVGTGGTLARAYGFFLGKILDVVGLGWLCAVFYGAAVFLIFQRAVAAFSIATPTTPPFNQFTLPYFLAFAIALAFFSAALAVALTRAATGQNDGRAGIYFVYGGRELRLFLALLRLYVFVAAATAAAGYLSTLAAAALSARIPGSQTWLGQPPGTVLMFAAFFITVCVFGFVHARLGFFLAPLAADGKRPLLRHAWRLSSGQTFAVVTVTLAIFVSVAAILAAVWLFAPHPDFAFASLTGHSHPVISPRLQGSAVFVATAAALVLWVLNALFAGAAASAYPRVAAKLERIASLEDVPLPAPVLAMAAPQPAGVAAFSDAMQGSFTPAPPTEPFPPPDPSPPEPLNVISEPVTLLASDSEAALAEPALAVPPAGPHTEDEHAPETTETHAADANVADEHPVDTKADETKVAEIKAAETHPESGDAPAKDAGPDGEKSADAPVIPPPSSSEVPPISQETVPSEAA